MARLLLILTEFPPSIGGMQTHAIHLANHLHQAGHTVEVVTHRTRRDDADAFDQRLPFPVHRSLSRLAYFNNLRLLRRRLTKVDAVYASTVFYGALGDEVPVYCRCAGNDVLRPWIAYPFETGSALAAQPWLDDSLYAWFKRWKRPDFVHGWFRQRRFALMRQALMGNSHVFANSDFTGALLRAEGIDRFTVIPGGVDTAEFAPGSASPKRSGFTFLTACRLVAKKGLETFIAAARLVRDRIPESRFIIAGDGPRQQALMRLADDGLITFAGRVPHDQMKHHYHAADCFVLSSREHVHPRTGLRDVETMGRVLCEANAAGVPVIAANTGGIPSIISHGDNGLLFEPENVDELAACMLLMATTPATAAKLARRGLERARLEWDWNVVLGRQLELMKLRAPVELLSRPRLD